MDPKIMSKIRRLGRYSQTYVTKSGECRTSAYWYGFWQENGKCKRVYIGRKLPKSLKYLIDGRFKKPGYQVYTWPGRRGGGDHHEANRAEDR